MKTLDRVIFSAIALALAAIALNPWLAPGYATAQSREIEVDIRKIDGVPINPKLQARYGVSIQGIPVVIQNR